MIPAGTTRGVGLRVGSFVVLSYGLSWAWVIPIAVSGMEVEAGRGWPTHFPALLGPAVAAVVVTVWWDGLAGLRRLPGRVRAAPRWWLFAVGPLVLVPLGLPDLDGFGVISGLPASWGVPLVVLTVLVVNGFGEETGWRGYAQAVLQARFGPLTATLLVAAVWAGWHVPMFFAVGSFAGFGPGTVVGWLIGLFCGAVVLAWLYNHTGSVALVAVWHSAFNLVSAPRAAQGAPAATSTTLVIAFAVVLVALELRARRRGLRSVLGGVSGEPAPAR